MRALLLIASLLPLAGQQATPAASADTKPVDSKSADTRPAESPVPSGESWILGSIDLGYRWRTDVSGSWDTYRSIVNLGSGPKLIGADFTLTDPKHRAFDQIHVRAYSWGDDPYSTFHLDARKSKLYDFNADYRDIAYFNFLPSYADPLLARGIVLSEQSFDTHRRFANFTLDLLPGNWFIPYLAYDRDSGSGTGATAFVSDGNEYPVPNRLRDLTSLYRGGARFELRRVHATLEQGGTTFKDDQSVYQNTGSTNYGNVLTPVFGQKLDLTSLLASYGIRGTSIYSKGLFTASAASWLDLYGQFLYSQPDSDVNYQQAATGNLYLQSQLLFYSSQQYLLSAAAKLPHTTASFGAEIRPLHRVRIIESWLTDRLHNAGSAASNQILSGAGVSQQTTALLSSSIATNYNQQEIDILFDATSKLTLRGGYRYVWGDASDAILPLAGLVSSDQGKLRRNVGLGAVTFRPSHKISITGEAEGASTGGAYFRTSLYNYQKVRAQARYQATTSLSLSADFTLLNNQNPLPGVNYDYLAHQESLSIFWSPAGGKKGDFEGSYSRSDLRSNIGYFAPQDLAPQTSRYRDNSHTATALFNFTLPNSSRIAPKLTAGGSFFLSSGNRPASYYQPVAKLWVPLGKHVNWFTEWRYYGYGEAFYLYEGFRTHLVTTGLRVTR
jgi:hypothetical protein